MPQDTSHIIPNLEELLKLEHLVASNSLKLLPNQPVYSILAGKHTSKLRGRGLDFEEARKYVAGDDIRNIDWRVTARTGSTYTKVFTEEKEKPVLVITDMSSGMFFGSKIYTKAVVAAQVAAISAFRVLKNSDRFGGIIFNEETHTPFQSQRSRKVVLRYLQTLVENGEKWLSNPQKIENKATIYQHILQHAHHMATHDYLIVIVSDFYDFSPENYKQVFELAKHNDVILTQVTDPLEKELPSEKLVLSDGGLQLLWKSKKKKWQEAYKHKVQQETEQLTLEMEKRGIPVISMDSTEAAEAQMRTLLKSKLKMKKR